MPSPSPPGMSWRWPCPRSALCAARWCRGAEECHGGGDRSGQYGSMGVWEYGCVRPFPHPYTHAPILPYSHTRRRALAEEPPMTATLPRPADYFVDRLRELQVRIRGEVRRQQERLTSEEMSRIQAARDGDTIYGIDVHAEALLFAFCEEWSRELPLVLVAEGIEGSGARPFPEGLREADAACRLLIDPI